MWRAIKYPRFVRNAGLVFGGAKRDRTADLNTASVALSQLSYSPKVLLGLRPEAGRIVCSRFGSVKENIPYLLPLLQANQMVNYCAGVASSACLRYSLGLNPVTRKNSLLKLDLVLNPASIIRVVIGISGLSRSMVCAALTRQSLRYCEKLPP